MWKAPAPMRGEKRDEKKEMETLVRLKVRSSFVRLEMEMSGMEPVAEKI